MDRRVQSVRELGEEPRPNLSMGEMREVERPPPPKGGWNAKLAENLQDLAVKTSEDQRYAVEAILSGYGNREEREPPYAKRPNCTDLCWGVLRTYYRSAPASGSTALCAGGSVRRRMDKTNAHGISGYLSRAHDFAVAIADEAYAEVARLYPELASPPRKMGGE